MSKLDIVLEGLEASQVYIRCTIRDLRLKGDIVHLKIIELILEDLVQYIDRTIYLIED